MGSHYSTDGPQPLMLLVPCIAFAYLVTLFLSTIGVLRSSPRFYSRANKVIAIYAFVGFFTYYMTLLVIWIIAFPCALVLGVLVKLGVIQPANYHTLEQLLVPLLIAHLAAQFWAWFVAIRWSRDAL